MKKSVTNMWWFDWWKAVIVLSFLFILLLPLRCLAINFSYESIDNKYSAFGINDNGDIVGATGFSFSAYLFSEGSFYDLNPLPNDEPGAVYGINNNGKTVGFYSDATAYSGVYNTGTGVYTSFETFQYEHPDDGLRATYARDINIDNWIVGMCRYGGDSGVQSHSFLKIYGSISIIDFPGYDASSAMGINDLGHIVGLYFNTDDNMWKGFLYDSTDFVHSSISVSGSNETKLYDINNDGWIIGEYTDSDDHRHGFIKIDDLYTELMFPDASITIPYGINSDGWIVGQYFKDGTYTAFLAKPTNEVVPEPTTVLLLGAGLIGLAGLGRKRFFKKD